MPRSSPQRRSRPHGIAGRPTSTAAAPAPRFADVRVATGVRLHYLEQGPRTGRPVVLVHGLSDTWFSFSRLLPHLGDHRVFALDLRGHGDSERPWHGYTPREMAEDVIAFMDAMALQRATIVGHSMGSFIAQQAALLAPDRVAGLVLMGAAPSARTEALLELQQQLQALPPEVPADFAREFQAGTVHQPPPAEFMERVVAECRKAPAWVWRAALAGLIGTERFTGLSGSRIPSLLIWGEHDALFSRADQETLVAALSIGSLQVYRETGHAPHWERPRDVARALDRFLRTGPV